MLKNRLCYLLILFCTGLFFICFNGYSSAFVFALSLALPALSLLLSLPGILTLKLSVSVQDRELPVRALKSAPVLLRIRAVTASAIPAGRARTRLMVTNTFTGECRWEQLEFSPSRLPQMLEHTLSSSTCGVISCRLTKARAYDLLGLFCLPVKIREDGLCRMIIQPNIFFPALELDFRQSPDSDGERYSARRPGGDPTELFGLREYRPGDRLNRVDWKLSQKMEALLVKESSLPVTNRALLLVDLSCGGLEADALMDALATLADFLVRQEAEYVVGFCQDRALKFLEVSEPEEAAPAIELVLCFASRQPLPSDRSVDSPAGISRVIYLCPAPDPAVLNLLEGRYPAAGMCVLHVKPLESEPCRLPEGRMIRLHPGHVAEDLEGLSF